MSDAVRRTLRTFLQVFVGVFSVSVLGFLNDIVEWASSTDRAFPSLSPLGKAAVSAACAGVVSLVTLAQNWAEDRTGKAFLIRKANPDPEPTQPPGDGAVFPDPEFDALRYDSPGIEPEDAHDISRDPADHDDLDDDWDIEITVHEPNEQTVSEQCPSMYRGRVCVLAKGHDGKHVRGEEL